MIKSDNENKWTRKGNEHEKPTRKQRLKHISNREWLRPQPEKEKINKHDSRIEIEKIKNTTHMARAASAILQHQPDPSTRLDFDPSALSLPPLLPYYPLHPSVHSTAASLPPAPYRAPPSVPPLHRHYPHFVTSSLPPCTPCQPRPRQQAGGWRARSAIH